MTTKIKQSILGGIIGTSAMSAIMFLGSFLGMPKLNPPSMLSAMMGIPILAGWLMHFMIGVIFALSYAILFEKLLHKIKSTTLKGVVFGLIAFVIAQIALGMMGAIFTMPPMEGSMMLMMVGSISGHIIFGIAVSNFSESN